MNFRLYFCIFQWTSIWATILISLESTSHRSNNGFFLLFLWAAQSSLHEASFRSFWLRFNIYISIEIGIKNIRRSLSVDHVRICVRLALTLGSSDSTCLIRTNISYLLRLNSWICGFWLFKSICGAHSHWNWSSIESKLRIWRKELLLYSSRSLLRLLDICFINIFLNNLIDIFISRI